MDIHAYPTDAHTPVDRAEATRLAADHLPPPQPDTERRIVEFATGFVAFEIRPLHAPVDRPLPVGGSVYVIDKATGAVSFWPTYSCAAVADRYEAGQVIVEDAWPDQDD
ncbi:hypothetical protein ACFWM1_34630 [Nocardia sp. NPDC058379]|uniref:hypothetical protein n=1 Tax=unclassified Nocardia TaxID=2637762 RepID=UPI003646D6C9